MQTFMFQTSIFRGKTEREYDVEVTYEADRHGCRVIDAKCDVDLTDDDFDGFEDQAVARADDDYAEWLADYGDYLHEQARDRAAMSYIPQVAA